MLPAAASATAVGNKSKHFCFCCITKRLVVVGVIAFRHAGTFRMISNTPFLTTSIHWNSRKDYGLLNNLGHLHAFDIASQNSISLEPCITSRIDDFGTTTVCGCASAASSTTANTTALVVIDQLVSRALTERIDGWNILDAR